MTAYHRVFILIYMNESRLGGPKFSRRTALKVGGGITVSGLILGREVKTFKEHTVDTPWGIFYPLYEEHALGIKADDVPGELDAFFREFSLLGSNFDDRLTNFINKKFQDEKGQEYEKKNMEFPILDKLAKNHTKLVYGDVLPALDFDSFLKDRFDEKVNRIKVGAAVLASRSMFIIFTNILDKVTHRTPSPKELSRRQFLAGVSLATTAIVETPLMET